MDSFEAIYKRYASTVKKYAISLGASDDLSDDITAETFYKALKNINSYDESKKMLTWLCSIAKNTYFDYIKKKDITIKTTIRCSTDKKSLEWFLDGEPTGSPVAYSTMWLREDREEIYNAGKKEFEAMIKGLNPSQIIVYGNIVPFMKGHEDKIIQLDKYTDKRWSDKDA